MGTPAAARAALITEMATLGRAPAKKAVAAAAAAEEESEPSPAASAGRPGADMSRVHFRSRQYKCVLYRLAPRAGGRRSEGGNVSLTRSPDGVRAEIEIARAIFI